MITICSRTSDHVEQQMLPEKRRAQHFIALQKFVDLEGSKSGNEGLQKNACCASRNIEMNGQKIGGTTSETRNAC